MGSGAPQDLGGHHLYGKQKPHGNTSNGTLNNCSRCFSGHLLPVCLAPANASSTLPFWGGQVCEMPSSKRELQANLQMYPYSLQLLASQQWLSFIYQLTKSHRCNKHHPLVKSFFRRELYVSHMVFSKHVSNVTLGLRTSQVKEHLIQKAVQNSNQPLNWKS